MTDRDGQVEQALDRALARALPPPQLPAQFRARLEATLAREQPVSLAEQRRQLEHEYRSRLSQLEVDYLRLRRRTLGTLIGGAFAAGAAAALALPWLQMTLGTLSPLLIGGAGAAVGLAIGTASLWSRLRAE